ncbi:MAG: hypothetical protein B7Y80_16885 [Hyphomicrobium sp. 32-62-53]|nr:MAG: hypothetical protein B7Z29_07995 [Hyphomicrobium sp. 12-62-95]OYX98051.1 MAG: hypothetical protein B7Y80_16885 [Hyphomicrobium sp. 32-62-53]
MRSIAFIREQLAERALAVCQTYLPNGRRNGQYWVVGDLAGSKGRSLYVRLAGRAGKWTDSATGEHGDLLDIIRHTGNHHSFGETIAEAERFLSLPTSHQHPTAPASAPSDRTGTARRLFQSGLPLGGTLADAYLASRGLVDCHRYDALRFHKQCYGRSADGNRFAYPALLAAITDLDGRLTGIHRTWLTTPPPSKAPLDEPRRSLGRMIGNGVRFRSAHDVLIAGEGLETVLTLTAVLPWIPAVAALTATHLSLLELPDTLQRLYIARDNDHAGQIAWRTLSAKALQHGAAPYALTPQLKDWNDDLRLLGLAHTQSLALSQLCPDDAPALASSAYSQNGP